MNAIDFTQKYSYEFINKPPQTLDYEEYNVDWFLSSRGDMMCRRGGYEITADILDRGHWLWFLTEKRWFDANTFLPAYYEACRRAGIKEVRITIGNH